MTPGTCWRCKGTGRIPLEGVLKTDTECPVCRETGKLPVNTILSTKADPRDGLLAGKTKPRTALILASDL